MALELFDSAQKATMDNGEWKMGTEHHGAATHSPFSIVHSPADYEFIGAFEGDLLSGFACFGPTPSTDRTYDLYWIAVHPDAQRLGVGATLMAEVEGVLRSRQARLVVVETSSKAEYEPTRSFYQKRGYQEAARLRDFYAPGDDRLVLTKRVGTLTTTV